MHSQVVRDAKTLDVSACTIACTPTTLWNFHNLIFYSMWFLMQEFVLIDRVKERIVSKFSLLWFGMKINLIMKGRCSIRIVVMSS